MARIVVTPQEFNYTLFEAPRIEQLAARAADAAGLPADAEVRIEIDEAVPLGRVRVTSLAPVTIAIEGGAIEDAKRPRHLSDVDVLGVLGRFLFRVADRLDPAFGDPPDDDALALDQHIAWVVTAVGRGERAGLPAAKPRWLYHFRNRHGFSDVADAAFERLWSMARPAWADIEAACAETSAERAAYTSSA